VRLIYWNVGSKQKCVTAMRMLALGTTTDAVGEMSWMRESTCLKTTMRFSHAVVQVFGGEYFRDSNAQDTKMLMAIREASGFPGMPGSVD
jgi:hypothetical protein